MSDFHDDVDITPNTGYDKPNRWTELLEAIATHPDKMEKMAMVEWVKMVEKYGLMHEVSDFTFIYLKNDVGLYSAMNEAMSEWDL